MAEPVRHEIRLSDIRKIGGMDNHTRASLTPLFEELRAVVIREGNPDNDEDRVVVGGLLDHAVLNRKDPASGDTLMSWFFGRSFIEMAERSNHWAIIDRQTVFHLGSKYSVLLFQHIASLTSLKHVTSKTFTVQELRAMMGVPEGKLQSFGHFNSRAIIPAIAEINQLSRMTLTATPNKIGRTVASVTIAWEVKPDPTETRRELDRPKVGRVARRDGKTEMLVPPFPASGGLSPSIPLDAHWRALFEAHVTRIQGGKLPDSKLVCDAFRKSRGDKLDDTTTERHFINFCKAWRG
ncbi:MAG: replication initiation protein [Microgenomates group bacterium]